MLTVCLQSFNFDDEFFSQGKLNNQLTKSRKHQARHEHAGDQLRQKASLGMSVAQIRKLEENDSSFEKFRKRSRL